MGYPMDMRVTYCATFFICGSPNETFAGAEPCRTPDVAKAKQLLAEAGYKGEKVVLLVPSDITYLNAEALMAAQTLRSIGMNVDAQTMRLGDDRRRAAPRRTRPRPAAGTCTSPWPAASTPTRRSPTPTSAPRAATPLPGWPCDKELDELRTAWLKETNPAKRKELLDTFHARPTRRCPTSTPASTRRRSRRARRSRAPTSCSAACHRSGSSTSRAAAGCAA